MCASGVRVINIKTVVSLFRSITVKKERLFASQMNQGGRRATDILTPRWAHMRGMKQPTWLVWERTSFGFGFVTDLDLTASCSIALVDDLRKKGGHLLLFFLGMEPCLQGGSSCRRKIDIYEYRI